jgi:hypothetical protein
VKRLVNELANSALKVRQNLSQRISNARLFSDCSRGCTSGYFLLTASPLKIFCRIYFSKTINAFLSFEIVQPRAKVAWLCAPFGVV